jgi:hypothetical protein
LVLCRIAEDCIIKCILCSKIECTSIFLDALVHILAKLAVCKPQNRVSAAYDKECLFSMSVTCYLLLDHLHFYFFIKRFASGTALWITRVAGDVEARSLRCLEKGRRTTRRLRSPAGTEAVPLQLL